MYSDMPPELRSYLEGILDAALAQAGVTMHNQQTRERVLWKLLDELDAFVFLQLRAALPPSERVRFLTLLKLGVTEDELQAFAARAIPDLPVFAQGIFVEFRAHYLQAEGRGI